MKTFNAFVLALCVVCTTSTKLSNIEHATEIDMETRIIGGEDAKLGQFPYQVSLRNALNRQHFCGGSIISQRFILTAAHCTQGLNALPFFVDAVVGAIRLKGGGFTVKLNKIIPHQNYNPKKLQNDISLIRTRQDIIFTNVIDAIALSKIDLPSDGITPVILSGWGRSKVIY